MAPAHRIHRRTSLAARLGLASVLAALAGSALLAAGSAAASGSSAPLLAPAHLGPYVQQSAVKILTSNERGKKIIARLATTNKHSERNVSSAYGGARSLVESYSSQDLNTLFTLIVVRASSPGLYALYQDATYLGLERAPREMLAFGATSCLVQNDPTAAGGTPAADSVHVLECQRTGPHLTVTVTSIGSDTLGNHPRAVAAVVDAAWQAISKE